jgi:hypothetical protein
MTTIVQNKQNKTNSIGKIIAGIGGGIAIVGVIAGTAVALKDKKSRDKVKKAFLHIKDKVGDYIETMHKDPIVEEGNHSVKTLETNVKKFAEKMSKEGENL